MKQTKKVLGSSECLKTTELGKGLTAISDGVVRKASLWRDIQAKMGKVTEVSHRRSKCKGLTARTSLECSCIRMDEFPQNLNPSWSISYVSL